MCQPPALVPTYLQGSSALPQLLLDVFLCCIPCPFLHQHPLLQGEHVAAKSQGQVGKGCLQGGEVTGGTLGHVLLSPRHRQTSQRATKWGSAQDNQHLPCPSTHYAAVCWEQSLEMPARGETSPRQPIRHGNLEPSWQEHTPGRRQPSLRVPADS